LEAESGSALASLAATRLEPERPRAHPLLTCVMAVGKVEEASGSGRPARALAQSQRARTHSRTHARSHSLSRASL